MGGLIVRDKLEIGYTAVIRGKVSARTIAIAKGAIVDGEIEVTSDTPVLQFEEKREDRRSELSRETKSQRRSRATVREWRQDSKLVCSRVITHSSARFLKPQSK